MFHSDLIKKISLIIIFAFVIGGIFWLRFSRTQQPTTSKDTVSVATSFYPLYFFASEIGGKQTQVTNITPAGSEPHDYEPTPQDIVTISQSKLLILNGAGLEAWGDKIRSTIDTKNTTVVIASEGLSDLQENENGRQVVDPHIWLSPKRAGVEVERIADGLTVVDPTHSDLYTKNKATLLQKLSDLDTEYKQGLSQCDRREIVTSHAAFAYLAHDYNLTQVPIAGISPEEEPSPSQLAAIASFAKEHHATTIFFESLTSPKLSETIATEVGAKTEVLNPLEGLTQDDMQQGKNYFTIMRDNLHTLQTALSCI